MAQFGSAPALGAGGRRFKSCCPDETPVVHNTSIIYGLSGVCPGRPHPAVTAMMVDGVDSPAVPYPPDGSGHGFYYSVNDRLLKNRHQESDS